MHIKIISIIIIILSIGWVIVWYYIKDQPLWQKTNNNNVSQNIISNNLTKKPMNPIDPKAQTLVDQYHEFTKKLSDEGKKGKFTAEDKVALNQMSQIGQELYTKYNIDKVSLVISTMANGYDLSITINGKDTWIQGGQGASMRLFNTDSIMSLISTPDIVAHNFILNKGENTIVIKYKKTRANPDDTLEVELSNDENNTILLVTAKNKTEGTIEKTFTIDPSKPTDLQTITINE